MHTSSGDESFNHWYIPSRHCQVQSCGEVGVRECCKKAQDQLTCPAITVLEIDRGRCELLGGGERQEVNSDLSRCVNVA